MKKYRTAYQAAKSYAQKFDKREEFEEDPNKFTDKLLVEGILNDVKAPDIGGVRWMLIDGSRWYVFDDQGNEIDGPYEMKKNAMQAIDEDSSSRMATSVYKSDTKKLFVARKNKFLDWWWNNR